MESKMVKTKEAALFLGVSVRQMERWRTEGGGPVFYKYSPRPRSSVVYSMADLEEFREASRYTSTTEYSDAG